MIKVYFVTLPDGYFGSSVRAWNSLDIKIISKELIENGFEVIETTIDKIFDKKLSNNDFLVYTSSDEENIRKYIQDVLYFVKDKCCLVPSYEVLLAHENKGFQDLFRKEHDFGSLDGKYHFDVDCLPKKYPFVFKTVSGSGSIGVELIKNSSDLNKIHKAHFKISPKRRLINLLRSRHLTSYEYKTYSYRHKCFSRYVVQEFVPNLTCDYRVLIFGDKYYIMRRDVRENDFRASGSKKFSYTDAPKEVLDFSKIVYSKINSPYASLDIAFDNNKECSLIEYQGMNFGSSALRNSEGYHQWDLENMSWKYTSKKSHLEEEFSNAIYFHIVNKLKSYKE